MGWFWKRLEAPEWFVQFVDELEKLHRALPTEFAGPFERRVGSVELWMKAPTPRHRSAYLGGPEFDFEYSVGKIWTERLELTPDLCQHLLACLDALIAGRVREVRDLDSGLLWHIDRLKTRGLNTFVRDREYSFFWHSRWLNHRVRRVSITRIPPMISA